MKKRIVRMTAVLLSCFVLFNTQFIDVFAVGINGTPTAAIYELNDKAEYKYSSAVQKAGTLAYGAKSLGTANVYGNDLEESSFRNVTAFGATGPINIGYMYNGSYQTGTKTEWNLVSDSAKTVNGYDVGGKIQKGVIIIQKSSDGYNWAEACKPVVNFFGKNTKGNAAIYVASEDELKQGTYFKMIVAYEMEKQTKAGDISNWDGDWERHQYVEVYDFYLCYEANPVTVHDVASMGTINSGGSTKNGFYINRNGSTNRITVSKDGGTATEIVGTETFTKAGSYIITTTTKFGKNFSYAIRINDGIQIVNMSPVVYVSDDKKGYTTASVVRGKTEYGASNYTTLSIGQSANYDLITSTKNGFNSYGIAGDSINIFLRLNYEDNLTGNGWVLSDDSWGSAAKELVNGVQTGRVGTGALIIQKSNDGINWVNADAGRYASGLYTTSFRTNYGTGHDVLIYTPLGQDVVDGLYLRVVYAFEVKDASGKKVKNYLEEYKFYLCSSNLDAVTFHNLSVTDEIEKAISTEDQITMELYKRAETMLDGAYTVSGFEIDKALNSTATVTVKRDGVEVGYPSDGVFDESGKYDIEIKSAVGNKKNITLYVDRMSDKDSMKYYFGDSFISGKRIFSEGEYPVFEGGETQYHIEAIDDYHKDIKGVITNTSTGKTLQISSAAIAKDGSLVDAGHYVVQITTNDSYNSELKSGDAKIFTFQFDLIAQGTAPGPIVNQRSLEDYAHSTMCDAYPKYYGLTYSSVNSANITLAYQNKEDAFEEGYEYEKGLVEKPDDGTYRYTGSWFVTQKDKYDSVWELTEDIYNSVEQNIRTWYFDISDPFTYTTIEESVLGGAENPRALNLYHSAIVFANETQKEKLTELNTLPFINDKPVSFINENENKVSKDRAEFAFIADKYNCDSYLVQVRDCNNVEYKIKYNESVGQQLAAANCPSGIITIHEENIYGEAAEYQAIYISENDNTAIATIKYYLDKEEATISVSKIDSGKTVIEADAFTIEGIFDDLDPYGLVKIDDGTDTYIYCIDEVINDIWAVPGDYEITCVNRLGYDYSFTIHIKESDNLVVDFYGDGAEEIESILTTLGATNIQLPVLEKAGYDFLGFMDESNGEIYSNTIEIVQKTGSLKLKALWNVRKAKLTLVGVDNKVIGVQEVTFGNEYELPILDNVEGLYFKGWKKDDVFIVDNMIRIDKDEDLIIYAVYVNDDGVAISSNDIVSKSRSRLFQIIMLVILSLGGVSGIFCYIKMKHPKELINDEIAKSDEKESQEEFLEEKDETNKC